MNDIGPQKMNGQEEKELGRVFDLPGWILRAEKTDVGDDAEKRKKGYD